MANDMKHFIRTDAAGNGKVTIVSNDPTVAFDDTLQTVEITDHPRREDIMQNPHYFKIKKSGKKFVFTEKTKAEKTAAEVSGRPLSRPNVIADMQKQIDALLGRITALEAAQAAKPK